MLPTVRAGARDPLAGVVQCDGGCCRGCKDWASPGATVEPGQVLRLLQDSYICLDSEH